MTSRLRNDGSGGGGPCLALPTRGQLAALTPFARRVVAERARLAMLDPNGETDAVRPLDGVAARALLLALTDLEDVAGRRPASRRGLQAIAHAAGRDLLNKLGADPSRNSGRVVCPAHGGRDRNLAWRLTPTGRVLLSCKSHHCDFVAIRDAVA
jgi:hypothetical protein